MKLKVWDQPTRFFHWMLAASVAGAFITSSEPTALTLHIYLGEVALGLFIFRVGYGFLGSYYSRYHTFLKGPRAVISYAKALARLKPPKVVGHNPLGSWVFGVLLICTGIASITGLLALGGQAKIGVLAHSLSVQFGAQMMEVHEWVAFTLLGFIGLHICGALTDSFLHKENLVASMVTGEKSTPDDFLAPADKELSPSGLAKGYVALCVVLTVGFMALWPLNFEAVETKAALTETRPADFDEYKEECGSCHFAFPPNTLPARSWDRMMNELEDHFGDDATIGEEEDIQEITAYLEANAAENSKTAWAYYLTKGLKPTDTPQAITELKYWKDRHEDIDPERFKEKPIGNKINCGACHHYADYGSFENAHIKIPDPQP